MSREASYWRIHSQLRKHRGPAKNWCCTHCSCPAHDWAYKFGSVGDSPHSENMDDYIPLCRLCHRALDKDSAGVA